MEGIIACLCLTTLSLINPVMSQMQSAPWSYSGPTGPSNWGKLPGAQACYGRTQSPININTFETGHKSFPPFSFSGNYLSGPGSMRVTSMINTGYTVRINLEGNYFVSGGGLPSRYKAIDIHLHWGSVNSQGSEHTRNQRAFPAEMHIAHYDAKKYSSMRDALTKQNGLAILGFWINLGDHNSAWDVIINNLAAIKYTNSAYVFTESFPIISLLPTDLTRFYRYSGSLTTPGCYESAIWTMFDNEIVLSRAQISKLRQLSKYETAPYGPGAGPLLHRRLVDNFRPVQRLWFRTIYQSWSHTTFYSYGVVFGSPGKVPASEPARFDAGVDENAKFEYDDYRAYGTGLERLWQALRNGQFGEDQDVNYYDYDYGNTNPVDQEYTYEHKTVQKTHHKHHGNHNGRA